MMEKQLLTGVVPGMMYPSRVSDRSAGPVAGERDHTFFFLLFQSPTFQAGMWKMLSMVLFVLMTVGATYAQEKFTINGTIKDASDGEVLIGATVYILEIKGGSTTNEYGFYSITLPPATYTMRVSYIGYSDVAKTLVVDQNRQVSIELAAESTELEEVVVKAELEQANAQNLEMSTNKLEMNTILKIPTLLGETDVIRSLLLLPGVSTVGEGASGYNVRGGSVGQNLILLDEAPVYNSSHLLGFFSVFNPDAVKDAKLYKGAVAARYGGRLASILDVRMKDGNSKKFETTGGIGSIFSRLTFEGPIIKDKMSFIVAARRSYADVLAAPFVKLLKDGGALNFYDLTLKTNYSINRKNRLFLSGYFGKDNFRFDKSQGFNWGNATSSLRWNHLFSERIFSNVTLIYSKYDYALQFGSGDNNRFNWNSSISNYIVKPQFTYFINSNNELNFGAEMTYYTFEPANIVGSTNGQVLDVSMEKKYNLETAVHIGNSQQINDHFSIDYGVRLSNFQYFGPGTAYTYNDTVPGIRRSVTGALPYKRGEAIATYNNPEPRFSFKWQSTETSSVKGSYNRMVQYLHLISNTTASNPLDIWTPSSNNLKPQLADQYTLGYFKDLGAARQYEVSAEVYFKKTQNQIDYINGAEVLVNPNLEGDLLSGVGRAYGVETYFQKKTGRLTGWMSYTLGKSELQVDGINNNDWYNTRYNQTHNLKVAAFYDVNKRWSVSGNFVYLSGTPTTFPTSRVMMQGVLVPYNANNSRNNITLPSYHRLDISVTLQGREMKNGRKRRNSDNWVFSLYNVYARKNPFSIYFSQEDKRVPQGQSLQSKATQLSIIGTIVPSVSYNFKF